MQNKNNNKIKNIFHRLLSYKLKAKSLQLSGGFTLLEVMVAIAIFTIIMVMGISALLNVGNTHKKAQNMRSIIDTVSYLMEDMARNIRLGSDYYCISPQIGDGNPDVIATDKRGAQSCNESNGASGALALSIEPQEGKPYDPTSTVDTDPHLDDQVVYWIGVRPLETNPDNDPLNCELKKSTLGGRDGSFVSVTPNEVWIDCATSGFDVYGPTTAGGVSIDPNEPSRVIIRLAGTIHYKNTLTPFAVQTTVTQRALNKTTP